MERGMVVAALLGAAYALALGHQLDAGWWALVTVPAAALSAVACYLLTVAIASKAPRRLRYAVLLPTVTFALLWFGR